MKFSVVTNAFNQGMFLRRCMESVLRQADIELEYIVIDPGSTDGTEAILAEYEAVGDPRLTVVRERDNGPADGLNKGFARATGDWFIYINADDFFLKDAFKAAATAIRRHPHADCLYGSGYLTDAEGKAIRRVFSTAFSARKFVTGTALVLQQSTFYCADSFRKVGGFNVDNRTSWDAEILVDMSLAGMTLVKTTGLWSAFAIHGDSITGSQRHAAESRRNHDRLFFRVMGRQKTASDVAYAHRMTTFERILHPYRTFARLMDAWMPERLPTLDAELPKVECYPD